MMRPKFDILLLFSGGYDSALLFEMAGNMNKKVLCLIIDYGQTHKEEIAYAMKYCEDNGVHYTTLLLNVPVASNLTSEKRTYEGVSPYHVSSRNLMFISMAASIAESEGIPLIWFGANYEDKELLFPDCTQEWVYRLNQLLEINGSMKIKVEAPLLGMTKETITKLASVLKIEENKIFSGYGDNK